jgi:membrane protein YdbS with pleckstrin-like domain
VNKILYKQQYDNNSIEEGVPFYPLAVFRNKLLLTWLTAWVIITSSIYGLFGFIALMVSIDDDPSDSQFGEWIQSHIPNLVGGYLLISLALVIPIVLLTIFYVRNMEFRIEDTEIIVKKGIINKMEKHIPFRTITNVSSRYGIYDRFFRIGTVQIETAGRSGQQTGPEAKIEGIRNFFEVRNIILNRLRKFRGSYTTTTEIETPSFETAPPEGQFHKDLLSELREIKEILSK